MRTESIKAQFFYKRTFFLVFDASGCHGGANANTHVKVARFSTKQLLKKTYEIVHINFYKIMCS